MASMSRFFASVMRISPILLLELHLGLGEADVDRRDVGVTIGGTVAHDLDRAARALDGHVVRLHEVTNDQRGVIDAFREMRRHDLASVLENGDVVFAAAGVIDDRDRKSTRLNSSHIPFPLMSSS